MPKDFTACASGEGRVRRFRGPHKKLHLSAGEWCNICWDSKGSHRGETHKIKAATWTKTAKKK